MLVKLDGFFFLIREASEFLSFYKILTIGKLQVTKRSWPMTHGSNDSSLFVDFSSNLMELLILIKVPNGSVPTCKVYHIILLDIDFRSFLGVTQQLPESRVWVVLPAHLIHTVLQAHGVQWGISTFGADEVNSPTLLDEFVIEVDGLGEPETGGLLEGGEFLAAGDCDQGFLDHFVFGVNEISLLFANGKRLGFNIAVGNMIILETIRQKRISL